MLNPNPESIRRASSRYHRNRLLIQAVCWTVPTATMSSKGRNFRHSTLREGRRCTDLKLNGRCALTHPQRWDSTSQGLADASLAHIFALPAKTPGAACRCDLLGCTQFVRRCTRVWSEVRVVFKFGSGLCRWYCAALVVVRVLLYGVPNP